MRVLSRFSGMFTRGELVYAGSDAEPLMTQAVATLPACAADFRR